jgi:hypothetical protein
LQYLKVPPSPISFGRGGDKWNSLDSGTFLGKKSEEYNPTKYGMNLSNSLP